MTRVLGALILLLGSYSTAFAGAVSPFGQTIGLDTMASVRDALGSKTNLQSAGINRWSKGPMLESDGTGLNFESLSHVLFIFDADNVLAGVVLTLSKYRYDAITASLKNKYELTHERAPFVGNKSTRFREGDVRIEALAPHMSFNMRVRYLTDAFANAYEQRRADQERQQREREQSQL